MKEIKAYVHNHRIPDVIRALKESGQCNLDPAKGCRNLSVIGVRSLLAPVDAQERHYAVDLAEEVINESRLELICEDHQVDELMDIIGRAARTGQAEAGWIYVTDIIKAIPVAGRP
ncbi:P-II family nitrogen regulator [Sulfuriferula sp. GW1]|uniref:P-II family nitrogen regulator n=1 Tax=Sulfuriferula sp. GW1 TaxID=3345111 RepID=UPI0039B08E7D